MKTLITLRKYFGAILTLLIVAAAFSNASAQSQGRIDKLSQTTFNSKFVSIVGQSGTVGLGMQGCISCDAAVAMPFSFNFDNNTFSAGTTFYINSVGSLHFTSVNSSYYSRITPYFSGSASSYPLSICPMSGLQYPISGTGGVYYLTTGVAPNRVLTVEWNNMQDYWNSAKFTSYQAKLYEGSNQIEFWYQDLNYSIGGEQSSYYHNIGLNGNTTPSFLQVVVNGSTTNFSTPATNIRFAYPLPIELSVSPKNLIYGGVNAGTTVTLCVTVQHVGTGGSLNFLGASITGSSDFSIVSSPSGSLTAGQSAQYCIQFAPTGSGLRNGVFTIVTNGQDSGTQSVTLNGTGFSPLIVVDSTIRFKKTRTRMGDSLTQWVHIKSNGQAPLFFNSFKVVGIDQDQYHVSYFPANPLQPGLLDSLGITYVPTREGKHVAVLNLVNNSTNLPAIPISLQGTGILPHIVLTPTVLQFDSTAEGDTSCQTVDIWNPGTDTLRIIKNFLSSNDGDFHYTGVSGSDLLIAPDHHKTVGICFTPVQQGTRQGRLLIQTNIIPTYETPRRDTASILTLDLHGNGLPLGVFGNAISGLPVLDSTLVGVSVCRTDTVMNTGDADILVTGVTIGGTNASNFSQTGLTFPFLLKARSFKTFTICGDPDQQGLRTGLLSFTGTTGGRTIGLSTPLGVFGFKACISADPQTLFTGVVLPNNGSDSVQCVKIINCGDIAATYKVTIGGASSADYSVTPAISAVIASKDTATFCVTYKPSAVGQSPASLNVTTADNSESVSVPLAGADGCATLTHEAPNVPNTMAFEKGKFTFTITNGGSYPWSPGTGAISGADASHFKIISVVPDPIPAGGQGVVTMEFDPTNAIAYTAKLTFPSAGPCEDTVVSVDLSGLGLVSSVKETELDGFTLAQSYPNPSQGKVSFTYTTPKDVELSIKLVDMTGKTISTLISGRVSAGEHTVNFDASNLPSGTYVYLLESGATRLVRQLILTK